MLLRCQDIKATNNQRSFCLISNLSYRATNAEAENIEREIEQPSNGVGAAYRPPPRTKEVQVLVVWANKVVYP